MKKIVPLISSHVSGPLGIVHLPRLWLKVSLDVAGLLPEGYYCDKGYDAMLLSAIKVPLAAFRQFMQTRPSYIQLETWLQKQPGAQLDTATIHQFNTAVRQYHHKDSVRQEILAKAGLPANSPIPDAPTLNDLDDWTDFWAAWIKQ